MKRYSQQQISDLLDKFMEGLTSLEEEAALGDYFRTHEVPREWEDYRLMFGYFDRGMEGDLVPAEQPGPSLTRLMGRRWWGIASAACITAAIVATVVLHRPATTVTVPETPPAIAQKADSIAKAVETDPAPPQLAEAAPAHPVSLVNPVHPAHPTRPVSKSTRRLQAENAKLARENERLQRELADLKRRAFIIDLEANGFRAVQDEDGSIVLIDIEQELENELNKQPTTNIPAL